MQLLWGVFLFIPGAQAIRIVVRAMPYLVSGGAIVYYFRHATGQKLPSSTNWLTLSLLLLLLNLLHETAHLFAGLAQVVFQACISAPVFWMPRSVRSEAQDPTADLDRVCVQRAWARCSAFCRCTSPSAFFRRSSACWLAR